MNKSEIITKLKDKKTVRAFGLCSKEEQTVYKEADKKNCLCVSDVGTWVLPVKQGFDKRITYAINDDWEPEPEYDKRPVLISDSGMCRIEIPHTNDTYNVMVAAGDKDFDMYFFENLHGNQVYVAPHDVATAISDGQKVFGKFRRP